MENAERPSNMREAGRENQRSQGRLFSIKGKEWAGRSVWAWLTQVTTCLKTHTHTSVRNGFCSWNMINIKLNDPKKEAFAGVPSKML